MVSSYLRWFCMKSQRAVIPVMVNGALEGLEPHACSSEKCNGSHTGCYGEVGEGGKPSAGGWLQRQESQNTLRVLQSAARSRIQYLPFWLVQRCYWGWKGLWRKRHHRIWHHTQQNTWIIHLSQRSSNSSTTSIVTYSQPCLLSYACRQILILWDKRLFFCEFRNISMWIMTCRRREQAYSILLWGNIS